MPSNIVQINRAEELEWLVGDSKIEDLIRYLNEISSPTSEADSISSDASS